MAKNRILNFTGGEVAPSFYNAVGLEKFLESLMACRNYIIHRSGGVLNRLGDGHIGEVIDSSLEVRLIPFIASNKTTYVLELNAGVIRFIKNGRYLIDEYGDILELEVDYEDKLNELNYVQSADVMTLVRDDKQIKQIKKVTNLDWKYQDINFVSKVGKPSEDSIRSFIIFGIVK